MFSYVPFAQYVSRSASDVSSPKITVMPRKSEKRKLVDQLSRAVQTSFFVEIVNKDSNELISGEPMEDPFPITAALWLTHQALSSERFLMRSTNYRTGVQSNDQRWKEILGVGCESKYTDTEFLHLFRVSRRHFNKILDKIRDHHRMKSSGNFVLQPELMLLTALKYLGSEGNSGCPLRLKAELGIQGKGTLQRYCDRAIDALLSLEEEVLFWPSAEERKQISGRIEKKHHFPNCVTIVDGTHLKFAIRPEANGEDYFNRKQHYSLNVLVFCDDRRRIRHLVIGWPGSVHDNRIWNNCAICEHRESYFSEDEYGMGDSAFTSDDHMVGAYKKLPNQVLPVTQKWFNDMLSPPRSSVENTIGIWKGRFPFLRELRFKIRKNHAREDMLRIIRYVKASAILHNMVLSHPVPKSWLDPADVEHDGDDIGGDNAAVPQVGTTMRDRIHNHLELKLL